MAKTTEIVKADAPAVPAVGEPVGIEAILKLAIDREVPVESLERLVALHERVTERAAASEFNRALAAFQAECPSVPRSSRATITTKSGGQYGYSYAELDTIAKTVRPILERHGLSYTWDSVLEPNGLVRCTCTVRHVAGHSQSASFSAPTESSSAMSGAQKHAAALTFARRQSLIQVLGLTTCDPDTDGASEERVSEEQALQINDLVQESKANLQAFLQYMKASSIDDIRARDYLKAVEGLRAKMRKGGA